jgi:serine/threonine-protein kinase
VAALAPAALALPAPEPAPSPKPAPAPSRPLSFAARLNVNSIPAANVVLDGRPVGATPLMGLKVSPGAHTVVLIGKGGRAVRSITAAPGKTAVVGVRF